MARCAGREVPRRVRRRAGFRRAGRGTRRGGSVLMAYFNTTKLVGEELREAVSSSDALKHAVSRLFDLHKRLSPWQTLRLVDFGTINGVRCSITVLTDEG